MESRPYNYAASFIIGNFFLAYALFSTRFLKGYYKFDHNVLPRQDVDKYGPKAVKDGKLSQPALDMIRRNEGAHANAVEHFPFFIGTMVSGVILSCEHNGEQSRD